ncbi:MAG: YdcF family protein [Fibrobacter sp.]|nr:YdcF family protein [Fibrobacter sp.]
MAKIPTKKEKKRAKRIITIAAIVFVLLVIAFYLIMTQSGHWLVDDDEFDHVKWVAVLDGQSADLERSDYAASLLAEGRADSVLILGRRCLRNRNNAEFYVEDFMKLGDFDSNAVFMVPHDDPSTIGEAYTIIPWLKKHKADTVLLITTAAATHRVKRIFTKLSGDSPVFLTTDIHNYHYNADSWYTNRESRKNWLREWAALAVSYIDLWPAGNLTENDSAFYKSIISVAENERKKDPVVNLQDLLPKVQKKIAEATPDTVKTEDEDSSSSVQQSSSSSAQNKDDKKEKEPAKADSTKK